jgi:Zn-dependent protease/predicted transcriptional regulator
MKWSLKIGRISGIDVHLHLTFLLLIAWIALAYWQMEGTVEAVIGGIGFILALFACVVLHELGHAMMARRFGISTRSIVLLPIGGIASIEKTPEDPRQEILIALAGPLVSFGIAALLWLVLSAGSGIGSATPLGLSEGSFLQRLMLINLLLGAFNLLPAFPMDGGRVFRALLSLRLGPLRATRIAALVAQAAAILLALVGMRYNVFLVLIAIFIWIGATAEAGLASARSVLSVITARSAMETNFEVLAYDDSLGRAVALTLDGSQKDFPVMHDGAVVGVLRQADLLRGLHDHGKLCRVDQVMQEAPPTMQVGESLEHVLENMGSVTSGLLVVTEGGRMAGIIDIDNLMELLRIRKALQEHEKSSW